MQILREACLVSFCVFTAQFSISPLGGGLMGLLPACKVPPRMDAYSSIAGWIHICIESFRSFSSITCDTKLFGSG